MVYGDLDHSNLLGTSQTSYLFQVHSLTAKWNLGWAELSSTSSYGISKYIGNVDTTDIFVPLLHLSNEGLPLWEHFGTKKGTEEVKITSAPDPHLEWQGGLFFTHEISSYFQTLRAVNPQTLVPLDAPLFLNTILPSSYEEYAGFGDLTYHFTDRFSVQTGFRYSTQYQVGEENQVGILAPPNPPRVTSTAHVPTYLATPSYKLTEDVLAYFRFATGFRPGGPNLAVGANTPSTYAPDKTNNYELGMKGNFIDNLLFLDLSVYYIDWRDIQIKTTNASDFAYYTNAGGATSQGVEFTGQVRPAAGLTAYLTFAYDNAHLTQNLPVGVFGSSGDRLPYSPMYSGSAGTEYDFEVGEYQAFVGEDVTYTGQRFDSFQTSAPSPASCYLLIPLGRCAPD